MKYRIIQPCKELEDVVSHFWVSTWEDDGNLPQDQYYIIANSLTEITFAFTGPNSQNDFLFSIVQGQTVNPGQLTVPGFYHLIGVAMYPYAIPLLFGMSASDLNQEFVSLRTFLDSDGRILNEKMANATDTLARIEILTKYFISLRKRKDIRDSGMIRAIQEITRQKGNSKITELANQSFLSPKQFKRRFKEFSGFNPKTYNRIIRLESAIRDYPFVSNLTELAIESGYYDQAHFNREFKELTGFAPGKFWKLGEL